MLPGKYAAMRFEIISEETRNGSPLTPTATSLIMPDQARRQPIAFSVKKSSDKASKFNGFLAASPQYRPRNSSNWNEALTDVKQRGYGLNCFCFLDKVFVVLMSPKVFNHGGRFRSSRRLRLANFERHICPERARFHI
jgi:hypothetical protein